MLRYQILWWPTLSEYGIGKKGGLRYQIMVSEKYVCYDIRFWYWKITCATLSDFGIGK